MMWLPKVKWLEGKLSLRRRTGFFVDEKADCGVATCFPSLIPALLVRLSTIRKEISGITDYNE
jgi:hypothetical protein